MARYDDMADSDGAAEVALLIELGLDERAHVVDLGAGSGQFTLAVAPSCSRVVAVDVSSVMLERLRAKVAASATCNVEVVHAGFLTYGTLGRLPTPGGRSITSRTSGRRWRFTGRAGSFATEAFCGWRTSLIRSTRRRPRSESSSGAPLCPFRRPATMSGCGRIWRSMS